MADFDVSIRASYRDIARLVLDLSPGDYEATSDRRVSRWRNSAPPKYTGASYRFTDATFATHANRPLVGTNGGVAFRHALQTQLQTTYTGPTTKAWTIAWEMAPGEVTAAQAICADVAGWMRIWRLALPSGVNRGFDFGGLVTSPGDMALGTYMIATDGAATSSASMYKENALEASGVGAVSDMLITQLFLGRSDLGHYLDGELRSFRIWNRVFTAKERDFAFQSLGSINSAAGVTGTARAQMQIRAWVDATGDLSLRQARRVNPAAGRHQKFRCAVMSAEGAAIVQIACETDGDIVADTALGGDLYTLSTIERASSADPAATQDTGWSSVFDLRITDPGHYTFLLARANHGSVYVHLDAERA